MHSKSRDAAIAALSIAIAACSGNPTVQAPAPIKKSSADWNMLGYDIASTYWNQGETKITKKTAPKLEKAWEFDTGGHVTSTPVISAGKVYVVSSENGSKGVISIDLESGNELWHKEELKGSSSLALDGSVLYMNDVGGVIHALKVEDGSEIWHYQAPDSPTAVGFSSPVPTHDLVLFGMSTGEELSNPPAPQVFKGSIVALDKDGKLVWQKYTVEGDEHGATLWSTVSADETLGLVYGATGNNHGPPAGTTSDAFVAVPLAKGDAFSWTRQIFEGDTWSQNTSGPDNDFGANPIVFDFDGKKLVAGGNKGGDFWVLNRENGDQVAKVNLGPNNAYKGGIFVSGAWDGKHLLAVCNGATSTEPGSITPEAGTGTPSVLFALDPLTLDTKWSREFVGPSYSPITVANGVGFFGQRSTLQAFDTDTGDILMEFPTEGTIATAPAISNGYVVFGSGMTWFESTPGTKYYALKVP